jgi:hypothetical protein
MAGSCLSLANTARMAVGKKRTPSEDSHDPIVHGKVSRGKTLAAPEMTNAVDEPCHVPDPHDAHSPCTQSTLGSERVGKGKYQKNTPTKIRSPHTSRHSEFSSMMLLFMQQVISGYARVGESTTPLGQQSPAMTECSPAEQCGSK